MSIIQRLDKIIEVYRCRFNLRPDYILLGDTEYCKFKDEYNSYLYNIQGINNSEIKYRDIIVLRVYIKNHLSAGFSERWY